MWVKGCVENLAGRGVGGLDSDFLELVVPLFGRLLRGLVEAPAGKLGDEVFTGPLDAHGRQGDLDQHLLALVGAERCAGIVLADLLERERLGEFGHEVDLLVLGPPGGVAPAREGAVALGLDMGLGGLVPATAVFEVEDDGGGIGGGERVAVETHAGSGCELC